MCRIRAVEGLHAGGYVNERDGRIFINQKDLFITGQLEGYKANAHADGIITVMIDEMSKVMRSMVRNTGLWGKEETHGVSCLDRFMKPEQHLKLEQNPTSDQLWDFELRWRVGTARRNWRVNRAACNGISALVLAVTEKKHQKRCNEISVDYFETGDWLALKGTVAAPWLAICFQVWLEEIGKAVSEADNCKGHDAPHNTDNIHGMWAKLGRKRERGDVYNTLIRDTKRAKRGRTPRPTVDNPYQDDACVDHKKCFFPVGFGGAGFVLADDASPEMKTLYNEFVRLQLMETTDEEEEEEEEEEDRPDTPAPGGSGAAGGGSGEGTDGEPADDMDDTDDDAPHHTGADDGHEADDEASEEEQDGPPEREPEEEEVGPNEPQDVDQPITEDVAEPPEEEDVHPIPEDVAEPQEEEEDVEMVNEPQDVDQPIPEDVAEPQEEEDVEMNPQDVTPPIPEDVAEPQEEEDVEMPPNEQPIPTITSSAAEEDPQDRRSEEEMGPPTLFQGYTEGQIYKMVDENIQDTLRTINQVSQQMYGGRVYQTQQAPDYPMIPTHTPLPQPMTYTPYTPCTCAQCNNSYGWNAPLSPQPSIASVEGYVTPPTPLRQYLQLAPMMPYCGDTTCNSRCLGYVVDGR